MTIGIWFHPELEHIKRLLNYDYTLNNERSRHMLGLEYREID
jgi:hypothetical protein